MRLARSIFCASAVGLAVSAAFADNTDYYVEERGMSMSSVPPSVDETGTVRSPQLDESPNLDRVFEQADRNGSNALDPAESEAAMLASAPSSEDSLFARYDGNQDGVISWQEARADPELAQWFTAADSDRNGALTRGEFDMALDIAANAHRERAWRG